MGNIKHLKKKSIFVDSVLSVINENEAESGPIYDDSVLDKKNMSFI